MASDIISFIDCTSLNVSYDIVGLATVTFIIYANTPELQYKTSILGFEGYVTNINNQPVIQSPGWYTNTVTLIATKYS